MEYKIGDEVIIRKDLIHARYGGFPARPDAQLNFLGKSGKIIEESIVNTGEKDITIYKLDFGEWFSESMFSNKEYIEKFIVLDIIDEDIIIIDRKETELKIPKTKKYLLEKVIETLENGEDLLIFEEGEDKIYMNKFRNIEIFTSFDDKPIEILVEDISKYKEFLSRI